MDDLKLPWTSEINGGSVYIFNSDHKNIFCLPVDEDYDPATGGTSSGSKTADHILASCNP